MKKPIMSKIVAALAVAFLTTGTMLASDSTEVMATVNQFAAAMNKGDIKAAEAACSPQIAIIDEFPPYEWHGKKAFSQWIKDFETGSAKTGITEPSATLGKPRHVEVVGDRAYVVAPASFSFKKNGKTQKQTGATVALALQKSKAGWRLTGWAWCRG